MKALHNKRVTECVTVTDFPRRKHSAEITKAHPRGCSSSNIADVSFPEKLVPGL